MKKIRYIVPLFLTLSLNSFAQIAETATEISPLLIGETIPDVEVSTLDGKVVKASALISEKPTVLIFYRGGWCPYCNRQLSGMQEIQEDILSMGYQILTVSPDSPEKLKKTSEDQSLEYQLISDSKTTLMQTCGVAFQAPERKKEQLLEFSGGNNPGYLPVPTVFVLNQKGEILFEYINPNYRVRLDGAMLMAVLETLKE